MDKPQGPIRPRTHFMLPASGFFLNGTPSFSKRAHASATLGTEKPMWP